MGHGERNGYIPIPTSAFNIDVLIATVQPSAMHNNAMAPQFLAGQEQSESLQVPQQDSPTSSWIFN
jgi:hypothetical protein